MSEQKFIEFYVGHVAEDRLAFKIPSENRANVEAQLLKEKRLDKYIIIDPEEQERFRKQQEALREKLKAINSQKEEEKSAPKAVGVSPKKKTPINK